MASNRVDFITGLTKAEENAALTWLEEATALSDLSAIQAKNVFKIIRGLDGTVRALIGGGVTRDEMATSVELNPHVQVLSDGSKFNMDSGRCAR